MIDRLQSFATEGHLIVNYRSAQSIWLLYTTLTVIQYASSLGLTFPRTTNPASVSNTVTYYLCGERNPVDDKQIDVAQPSNLIYFLFSFSTS